MDINITLLGEMISFGVLVWFTMKFIWPPVVKAMQERQKKIADGLEAAARSQLDLSLAQEKIGGMLKDARREATKITDHANKRISGMIDAGKLSAKKEGDKMLELAKGDIDKEARNAKSQLHKDIASLAVNCAETILGKQIDAKANQALVDKFIEQI